MITEVKERLASELNRLSHELATEMTAEAGRLGAAVAKAPPADPERVWLQARIRRLGQLVAGLPALGSEALPLDRVGYGSAVELEDVATGQRISFTLVTAEVIDLDEDQVTLASPIGAALLGRKAGERITVALPQGSRRYRVVSVATLPQILGLHAPGRRARGVQAV